MSLRQFDTMGLNKKLLVWKLTAIHLSIIICLIQVAAGGHVYHYMNFQNLNLDTQESSI